VLSIALVELVDEWGKTVDDKYVVRVIYKKDNSVLFHAIPERSKHFMPMLGQTQKAGLN
jgi:hypothetical protein